VSLESNKLAKEIWYATILWVVGFVWGMIVFAVTEGLAIDPASFKVARSQLCSFAVILVDAVVSYTTVACFGSGKSD
jgi:hypothetical protein